MPADETHHIKWVTDGGSNEKANLIDVCHECHRYAPNDPALLDDYRKQRGVYGEIVHMGIMYGYRAAKDGQSEECCIENFYNDVFIKIVEEDSYALKNIRFYFLKERANVVRKKMRNKAVSVGGMLGGGHPYGYKIVDGKYVVVLDEAEIVKEIFIRYLEGTSTMKIVHLLTTCSVPTKRGGSWDTATVSSILKNTIYAGYVEWGDTLRKGEHQALVDTSTFNKVQERLVRYIRRPAQKYTPRLLPS